jgi:tRNA(Ile)-lysidine synthetase-like protein
VQLRGGTDWGGFSHVEFGHWSGTTECFLSRQFLTDAPLHYGLWRLSMEATPEPCSTAGPDQLVIDESRLPLLVVRQWEHGDRIRLTNGGRQKVQDVFTNAKVSEWERRDWPLVVDQAGEVIWVVGIKRGAQPLPAAANSMLIVATRRPA